MVDSERRFLLQLSLVLKVPVFELEQWPASVIQEYRALNVVSPFTKDADNIRDGLLIQLVRNQNVTKKEHYKTADKLLPYLQTYPEFLEHPTVKKAESLLNTCVLPKQRENILNLITEEIQLEREKPEPDDYVIFRLTEILNKEQSKATQ